MHPVSLRCSSVEYSRYSPSSRLARRAPQRSRATPYLRTRALAARGVVVGERPSTSHREALERVDVPGPALASLARYLDLVERWSQRINLTAARSPDQRVSTLIRSALAAEPQVEPPSLLDIGSGAGSPGLVLALLRVELSVTLLEPRSRRWAFLREASRVLGRGDIRVEACRHDQWEGPAARTVTLRGLRLPAAEIARCCQAGGRVVVIGNLPVPLEPLELEHSDRESAVHSLRCRCST